jgi:branched-chain amino acid transport system ATP-binding protein
LALDPLLPTNRGDWLLEVDQLTVDYGHARAVDGLSLRVAPGSIVTIIGPNGAGKTTTLSALMGLRPATGRVRYAGRSLLDRDVATRVADRLALVPETRELFAEMSVEENLRLGAFQRYRRGERDFKVDFAHVHRLFPRLLERSRQLAGTLSGGERQMLAIGRALMAKPRLLMLDEPSLGLAPLVIAEIFSIIAALRREGVAILLVEQNATAALKVADYAYVIESGRIVLQGSASELASDPRVALTYLGVGDDTQETGDGYADTSSSRSTQDT